MANVGIIDATLSSISESKVLCVDSEINSDGNLQKPDDLGSAVDKTGNEKPGQEKELVVENGKGSDQQALQDVGNKFCVSPHVAMPRKSLLKRPKSETSISSITANPPKRIRIVENLETTNSSSCSQLSDGSESPELLEGADDMASVTEVSSCGETLRWLNSASCSIDQSSINVEFVRDNLIPVKRNFSVEIDMRFILTETCTSILASKTRIAGIGSSEFHLWLSRHAVHNTPNLKQISYKENFLKMANIDAVLNYDLTSPTELNCDSAVIGDEEKVYYIGDLWQNSKGFREYFLWKTSQQEKDFSTKIITMRTLGPTSTEANIKQKTDLLSSGIHALSDNADIGAPENVEAYGSSTEHHSILNVANIDNFIHFVLLRTNGKGLHTFVADNSDLSYVYESCREIRFQKYFYCQCLLALRSIREGGTFICKIFDTFTLFTNGLLFLMYKCFKSIAIHKPSSSSECSSERFLICKGKIENADSKYAIDFLSDCLDMVVNNQEQRRIVRRKIRKRLTVVKMEVQRIVPLRLILSHAEFFQYVRESNIRLTTKLADSIDDICQLFEQGDKARQNNLVKSLDQAHQSMLSSWNIPTGLSTAVTLLEPIKQLENFFVKHAISTDMCSFKKLDLEVDENASSKRDVLTFPIQLSSPGNIFKSMHGWFFGCGESQILHLHNNLWTRVAYTEFSLPSGTLVLGEISEEICATDGKKKFIPSFHLFDGIFVRGTYIGSMPFKNRQAILARLMTTLKTQSTNVNCSIAQSISSDQLSTFYLSAKANDVMGYGKFVKCQPRQDGDSTDENFTLVDGFLIIKSAPDLSPQNFLNTCERLVLTWDKEEEAMKTDIMELQSRLA